jgi:tRNA pseudouridine38-40 synthase
MPRYFIDLAYKGTRYSGFQVQQNATTIQGEVEKAIKVLLGSSILPSPSGEGPGVRLTGSSRTDAGVHALQNFFHFDFEEKLNPEFIYKMNALLPTDIAIKKIHQMHPEAHARYDALSREYEYKIYKTKNPFLKDTAYYYPFKIDLELIKEACAVVKDGTNFFAFSKTRTQVNNYTCLVSDSEWQTENDIQTYRIKANRFLRGMVRLLTASLLQIGRRNLTIEDFLSLLNATSKKCELSVPPQGLFLKEVTYPPHFFQSQSQS